MKSLICVAVVAAGLAVLPAHASELGILLDEQVGSSQSFKVATPLAVGQTGVSFDASKPRGYGIRGAYTVLQLKKAEVGITATYHPETRTDLVVNGSNDGRLNNQYIALGAQVDWNFLVNLHAGIDIRRERLTTEGNSLVPDGKHHLYATLDQGRHRLHDVLAVREPLRPPGSGRGCHQAGQRQRQLVPGRLPEGDGSRVPGRLLRRHPVLTFPR